VLPTASVRTLEVVEDAGLKVGVTPLGWPDAANVTLPVSGLTSVTVIVSVPLEPAATESVVDEGFKVKLPVEVTFSVKEVVALLLPEFPVTVTVNAPVVAVLLAVSVRTVDVAEDVGLNEEVTPLGRPDTLNDTVPVNPGRSVTVMVSVALVPWATERVVGDDARVKPVAGMVTVMVTELVTEPSVPTILI
jgi:hypothetical protein